MEILKARIDWNDGFVNYPTIRMLVDKVPDHREMAYEMREGLYFAESGGYVSYLYWVRPDMGYGGRTFELTMKDGTKKYLKGPWSSNSMHANDLGFIPSIEAIVTADPYVWERGHTFFAGSVTIALIQQYAHLIDVGRPELVGGRVELVDDGAGHWNFQVVMPDGRLFVKAGMNFCFLDKDDVKDNSVKREQKGRPMFPEISQEQATAVKFGIGERG